MRVVEKPEWLNRNDNYGPPNWSGEKNPFYGKSHSEKTKELYRIKMNQRMQNKEYRLKLKEASKNADRTYQRSQEFSEKQSKALKRAHIEGRVKVSFPGEKNGMYGKTHNATSVALMRERKLGKYDGEKNPMHGKTHSEEARKSISAARASSKWIHKNGHQKSVRLNELQTYLDQGWQLGRGNMQKRKWVNDGNGHSRCVDAEDAIRLTYLGWQLGKG